MDCSRTPTRDPETWLDLAPEFSQAMARQVRAWIQRWEPDLTESSEWHMLCSSGRKLVCGTPKVLTRLKLKIKDITRRLVAMR
jgi:hypothetical protein